MRTCLVLTLLLSSALGHTAFAFERHPAHRARARPAAVPDGYVLTRHGFFHPSCVYTLRSDEMLSRDKVIRGLDGVVHDRITTCAYPRYDEAGALLPPDTAKVAHTGAYNGWLLAYRGGVEAGQKIPLGMTLESTWNVPSAPSNVTDQDVAFFTDIVLAVGQTNATIMQPVLDYGELVGSWGILSESCCFEGNDYQTDAVAVAPGDVVRGSVTSSGCDSTTGACASYSITTTSVTTGKSTVLTADSMGLVANEVDAAVLETYGVTSCDMLPSSGEVVFHAVTTDDKGNAVASTYVGANCAAGDCADPIPDTPTTCGWALSKSDDLFTLTFSPSPELVDGGATIDAVEDAGTSFDLAMRADLSVDPTMAQPDAAVATAPTSHGCSALPLGAAPPGATIFELALALLLVVVRRVRA